MKRNLFAIFLSVALVAATVFVIAPYAMAEGSNVVQATADGEITVAAGKILDLNGFAVTVSVEDPLYIIDTKNNSRTGEDENVGTVKNQGTGEIVTVSQDPVTKMRYLAIPNADGTYSAHPFNLTISQLGLNTKKEAICVRATFMANDKVKKIIDYGFSIGGVDTSAKENYPFNGNFLNAYADLTDSLISDAALDTQKTAKAYIKIGDYTVYSSNEAVITPRGVLKELNKAEIAAKVTETQKTAIAEMAKKMHLADLFTCFTGKSCTHSATTSATCLVPETCKNCENTIGGTVDHHDGDDVNTECDWCTKELSDYVELDASEMVVYEPSGHDYSNKGTVYGRDNVYGAIFNDWTVTAVAKTTAADNIMPAKSGFATWNDVRNNYKEKGYQYISVDFALSDGAKINVMGAVPPADGLTTGDVVTSGLVFTAGGNLGWASKCTSEEQRAYYAVYSNGMEIKVGDPIIAGQWYTVVVKLLVDGDKYSKGSQSYASVTFGGGNKYDQEIFFSKVRYYTNDSYKEDYDYAPDYDEKDASELAAYMPSADVYSKQSNEIFGRTNVYGATFTNWNVEVVAKTTVPKELTANKVTYSTGSDLESWTAVRNNYKTYGYQYVAIDFALSEGATIRAIGCFVNEAGTAITTGGPTFTVGNTITWLGNCKTQEQKDYFAVYSNGKKVTESDKIEAGKWYTVVVKLLTDVTGYSQNSYSSVAFNVGNGKMIYFSNVRYYRNETYKTDFVQAD